MSVSRGPQLLLSWGKSENRGLFIVTIKISSFISPCLRVSTHRLASSEGIPYSREYKYRYLILKIVHFLHEKVLARYLYSWGTTQQELKRCS